jgi:hypothetical protein
MRVKRSDASIIDRRQFRLSISRGMQLKRIPKPGIEVSAALKGTRTCSLTHFQRSGRWWCADANRAYRLASCLLVAHVRIEQTLEKIAQHAEAILNGLDIPDCA